MHKNKLIILIVALAANCVCFFQYQDILNEKRKSSEIASKMQLVARNCEQISYYKTKKKMFDQSNTKDELKRILLKSKIENVHVKRLSSSTVEIKFQSDKEADLHRCLADLYTKLSGIVCFSSIKMRKVNNDKISVMCVIQISPAHIDKKYVSINLSNKMRTPHVKLFSTQEQYKLLGVVNEKNACINNKWYKPGDSIDGYKITKIRDSSIELKRDDYQLIIPLGTAW